MREERLLELLDAHLDGALDAVGRGELEAELTVSADARRIYWEYAAQHALIREALLEERGARSAAPHAAVSRRIFRRSGSRWLAVSAAAAGILVACCLAFLLQKHPLQTGPVALSNHGSTPVEHRLADGTRLVLSPGARLVALGADRERGIRQIIRLESREIEVEAPHAADGQIACRVETPDGLWVETRGTTFKVARAFENEMGAKSPEAPVGAASAPILMIAVIEGMICAGRGEELRTEVASGGSAEIRILNEHFKERRAYWLRVTLENPAPRPAAEMIELARAFAELEDREDTRTACRKLLAAEDPDGDSMVLVDSSVASFETLSAAVRGAAFPTLKSIQDCRARLEAIRTAFFGRAGEAQPVRNYEEACRLTAEFLKAYPQYDVDANGQPGAARSALEALGREAEHRIMLLEAHRLMSTSCLALAFAARRDGKAENAEALFREGFRSADSAAKHLPRDGELAMTSARCLLGTGGKDEAARAYDIFVKLRQGTEGDERWWRATAGVVECLLILGKDDEARAIVRPLIMVSTAKTYGKYWLELPEIAKKLGV